MHCLNSPLFVEVLKVCACAPLAWNELVDQVIIDASVQHWCTRLRACIASEEAQFEHKL